MHLLLTTYVYILYTLLCCYPLFPFRAYFCFMCMDMPFSLPFLSPNCVCVCLLCLCLFVGHSVRLHLFSKSVEKVRKTIIIKVDAIYLKIIHDTFALGLKHDLSDRLEF